MTPSPVKANLYELEREMLGPVTKVIKYKYPDLDQQQACQEARKLIRYEFRTATEITIRRNNRLAIGGLVVGGVLVGVLYTLAALPGRPHPQALNAIKALIALAGTAFVLSRFSKNHALREQTNPSNQGKAIPSATGDRPAYLKAYSHLDALKRQCVHRPV